MNGLNVRTNNTECKSLKRKERTNANQSKLEDDGVVIQKDNEFVSSC